MTDEWTTLGSVTTWQSGGTPSKLNPDYWGGSVPWISASSLKGTRLSTSDQSLTTVGVAAGSKVAPEGAVLVLVRGMALHSELRAGVAARPLAFNQDVKAMLPISGVESEFVLFSLQARESQILKLVTSAGSGTGVLTSDRLKMLPLWIPSIQTQRDICSAVGEADLLIESLTRLIAKKRDVRQGVMQELLTGRIRLPGFTGAWTETVLREVLKFQPGFPFVSSHFTNSPSGRRLVRNRDLRSDDSKVYYEGSFPPQYLLSAGDVLIGMDGEFEPVIWRQDGALLNQRIGRLLLSKHVDGNFLAYALQAPLNEIQNDTGATTVKHLSHSDVESISLMLPPESEQSAIAEVLQNVDAEIEALERRLGSARAVKVGMMQELLTGRTRLPTEEEV